MEERFGVVGAPGPRQFFSGLTARTLAHGYLFSGPQGVGKKTFARRLAQSLLCVTPKSGLLGYCGHCSGCTRVQSDVHPDLWYVEGQVKIGDREGSGFHGEEATARDLVRQLSLHSYAGGKRIFILGDVEFTREAANALLKFFEEPPPDVHLLLTTDAPARLLPTIRSRMVDVTFARLTAPEVAEIVRRHGAAPDDAERVATIAGGSATRALTLLGGEGTIRDAVIGWFFAALAGEETDAASWATRAALDEGLEIVKTLVRDRLALQVGGAAPPLLAADQAERLRALPAVEPVALVRALAALTDAERIARTNVSPALVADLARVAIASAER